MMPDDVNEPVSTTRGSGLIERRRKAAPPQFSDGALPNLVVIGAQKCGTSSLHSYISRHPDIWMSQPKELDFFIAERNWDLGLDWYRGQFDPQAPLRGESSPDYTAAPRFEGVPARMAEVVPDAKLIYMVRDPIDRIRSQWIHNYTNRVQHKPFERAVLEDDEYIARSSYHRQLGLYLEHFPLDRILVIDQRDLEVRRRRALRTVFEFLGVRMIWRKRFKQRRMVTKRRRRNTVLGELVESYAPQPLRRAARNRRPFSFPVTPPELTDELRAELAARLRDDMARFRELAGRDFPEWSV